MILLTGGSGLLGANLLLVARDRRLKILPVTHSRSLAYASGESLQIDLADSDAVSEALQRLRPTAIIHCAAMTNVDQCERDPDLSERANVCMTRTIARSAAAIEAKLHFISTDSVFDGARGGYREEDEPNPLNLYARHKLEAERACLEALPESLILRTNFVGWSAVGGVGLVEWINARLEAGQPVPGFEDVIFAPLAVGDLSEIVLDMLEAGLSGVYHAASSEAVSKYDFARELARRFRFERARIDRARLADAGLGAPRPLDTSLIAAKLELALGRKLPSVTEGVERIARESESGHRERLKALLKG